MNALCYIIRACVHFFTGKVMPVHVTVDPKIKTTGANRTCMETCHLEKILTSPFLKINVSR